MNLFDLLFSLPELYQMTFLALSLILFPLLVTFIILRFSHKKIKISKTGVSIADEHNRRSGDENKKR